MQDNDNVPIHEMKPENQVTVECLNPGCKKPFNTLLPVAMILNDPRVSTVIYAKSPFACPHCTQTHIFNVQYIQNQYAYEAIEMPSKIIVPGVIQ